MAIVVNENYTCDINKLHINIPHFYGTGTVHYNI